MLRVRRLGGRARAGNEPPVLFPVVGCFAAFIAVCAQGSTDHENSDRSHYEGRFHNFVAMNSHDKRPKGQTYEHPLIRIETNEGVEGVGAGTYAKPDAAYLRALRPLIGADPMQLYVMDKGRIVGRSPAFAALLTDYMHLDGPLFDLIGKLTGKTAWQLIGESKRIRVRPYDSTFYFSDVWFSNQGVQAVVDAVRESQESGFTSFKFKLGRGFKWMEKDAGLKRDIAVTEAVRNTVGPAATIMGDPNNGYAGNPAGAWQLLSETRNANLHWIEQIFPASVSKYAWLKSKLAQAGMKTLIADGESWHETAEFGPYLKPRRLVDVLQMDIRRGGFLGNLAVARMGEAAGAITIPHNWASQIGLFMGLQFAKAVRTAPMAEDDRSTCDVIEASGYRFEEGFYTVSPDPGLGIRVDSKVYDSKYKKNEMVVA